MTPAPLSRAVLLPWAVSMVVMFVLSYLWHGFIMTDLRDIAYPKALYFALSGMVYAILGLVLTYGVHKAVQYELISLKGGMPFPVMAAALGAVLGFAVYLVAFVLGLSFAKGNMVHVLVDVLWQMVEQGIGGLAVSLGIIYDLHQRFLEQERG